jgi:hypothetical protein
MYDGEMFKTGLKTDGTYSIGQMELYDVGFASMFVSVLEYHLRKLIIVIRTEIMMV